MSSKQRRGSAAIVALSLTALIGFGALSVDIGLQRMTNLQLQTACDAGALGGAGHFNGQTQGIYDAIDGAVIVANQNEVFGGWTATANDVEVGYFDENDDWVVVTDIANADPNSVNGVRVTGGHQHDSVLARWFSSKYGSDFDTLPAVGEAIVVRPWAGPASAVLCYLPFAIPSCHFLTRPDGDAPRMELEFTGDDTVGWGMVGGINADVAKDAIIDKCNNDLDNDGEADELRMGDMMDTNNGQINAAVMLIVDIINGDHDIVDPTYPQEPYASVLGWEPNRNSVEANHISISDINPSNANSVNGFGWVVEGPVAILDMPNCADLNFTTDQAIAGFTYAYVYDANATGNGQKNLWMQFDFESEYKFGTDFDPDAIGNVIGQGPGTLVY